MKLQNLIRILFLLLITTTLKKKGTAPFIAFYPSFRISALTDSYLLPAPIGNYHAKDASQP